MSMRDTDVLSSELAALLARIEAEPAPPAARASRHVMLTLGTITMSRQAWAHHAGMTEDMLRKRLSRGMSLQEAVTTERARFTGDPISDVVARAKDNVCTDCRIKYHPHAMEFDHVRGEKKFDISKCHSRKDLDEELAKCELVCANCHRIRTFSRRK
jgi:hypothetical protein